MSEQITERLCNACGALTPVSQLVPSKRYRGGYMPCCKPCRNEYWRRLRSARPDVRQREKDAVRRCRLLADYGITQAQYEAMVVAQGNRCKLCGEADRGRSKRFGYWNIDHCHRTGRVRGLLCHTCNIGIGHFERVEAVLGRAAVLAYIDG